MKSRPPLLVLLSLLALSSLGCARSPRDAAVVAINASSDLGSAAESILASLYHAEEQRCIDPKVPLESQRACVAAARERYATAWKAYDDFRLSWLVADSGIKAYDIAVSNAKAWKKTPPTDVELAKVATSLADFEQKFKAALAALQGAK